MRSGSWPSTSFLRRRIRIGASVWPIRSSPVADDLADVVADLVFVQEAEGRPEAERSTNWTMEISSSSRFSSGVPVRTMA